MTCVLAANMLFGGGTRMSDLMEHKPRWFGRAARIGVALIVAVAVGSGGATPSLAQSNITGVYTVNGTALDGHSYAGSVTLAQVGQVYTANWQVGSGQYSGVGVLQGSSLAVGWGPPSCTVVNYKVQPNGSLLGAWSDLTSLGEGTETASPAAAGTGLVGTYTSVGTNPDASPYSGSLVVTAHGFVYQFQWQTGRTSFDGVGIQDGSSIAVGYDQSNQGRACGVALFTLDSSTTMSALWGEYGRDTEGTEMWLKQTV
jgi:hypothetical protein